MDLTPIKLALNNPNRVAQLLEYPGMTELSAWMDWAGKLVNEVERLRKLAYLDDHYFDDSTYKARLSEAIEGQRKAEAEAAVLRSEVEKLQSAEATHKAFYDLVVKERNYERVVNDRLRAENEALKNGQSPIV